MWSHLRYRGDAGNADLVVADLTLMDENGVELIAISEFVLRRVDADAVGDGLSHASGGSVGTLQEQAADVVQGNREVGITPANGAEALRRMLAHDRGPQVSVTAGDIRRIIVDVRRVTQESVADDLGDAAGSQQERTHAGEYVAPRTDLERTLCELWEGVLGAGKIGVDDDFFELGGNSLVAVQLIAQVRKAVGIRLPMRSLFEAPTIAGMAGVIDRLRNAPPPADDDKGPITRLPRN
jgi:acyl carrier protein